MAPLPLSSDPHSSRCGIPVPIGHYPHKAKSALPVMVSPVVPTKYLPKPTKCISDRRSARQNEAPRDGTPPPLKPQDRHQQIYTTQGPLP
ncbi:uncharacterized protein CANTADRAFT_266689 [Suhomyces tanzawaensis NRRL Y-17324]|uniref:Uncharacterized protein n=1 Tax=Suhomyces tanzawaensis NRRL Y-17324 TaxID=984487 RepID=A0A1E4SG81_9ASCO|nr:uncharacterized protein CANTADRAFT_266689 [Suhomyces tanzawaensis NRRL Y-17324]ODV78486.1 hypothetical protein CANTADRAFT_266689 [Suhomyces tanzawaensis NRRL Y-17324]